MVYQWVQIGLLYLIFLLQQLHVSLQTGFEQPTIFHRVYHKLLQQTYSTLLHELEKSYWQVQYNYLLQGSYLYSGLQNHSYSTCQAYYPCNQHQIYYLALLVILCSFTSHLMHLYLDEVQSPHLHKVLTLDCDDCLDLEQLQFVVILYLEILYYSDHNLMNESRLALLERYDCLKYYLLL